VLLFLHGGPPQHETWDPKPQAPLEVRGELAAISTCVPGIRIGELFPRVAQVVDRLTIVRSVTHHDSVHTSAGYTMLTGAYHARPNQPTAALVAPGPDDFPHPGSLVSLLRPSANGLPPFVALPEVIKDAGVNTYPGQGPGLLGERYAPFLVECDQTRQRLTVPDVFAVGDLALDRLLDRRALLARLATARAQLEQSGAAAQLTAFQQRALDMIASPQAQRAFDLEREPAAVRARYGEHLFGQGCLLARRLLEAGVALVSVYWQYEGPADSPAWDTHANNFPHMKNRLAPPTDRALSALVGELDERGLLADTLLVCLGEFGRSPRINRDAGRDHWPRVQSVLLAGAGLAGGRLYGASDRLGGLPAADPVTPPELTATILHLLGVPRQLELSDRQGRPLRAYQGDPVAGLMGG
jgi:hypothetical protein